MTEESQLTTIQAGLADWCKANKGEVHIAHDVPHLFRILGDSPGKARIGLLVAGEKPRDELNADVLARFDRKFWVAISRGYTLERYPGKSILEGVDGGKPMFQLLREARLAIRKLRFDVEDEPIPYYLGYELLTFEGVTLDAYRLEFVICSDDGDEAAIETPDQP